MPETTYHGLELFGGIDAVKQRFRKFCREITLTMPLEKTKYLERVCALDLDALSKFARGDNTLSDGQLKHIFMSQVTNPRDYLGSPTNFQDQAPYRKEDFEKKWKEVFPDPVERESCCPTLTDFVVSEASLEFCERD